MFFHCPFSDTIVRWIQKNAQGLHPTHFNSIALETNYFMASASGAMSL